MQIRSLILASLGAAVFAVSTDAGTPAAAVAETKKTSKSVVPSKYAGKYKGGGSGPVPEFIKAQSYENGAIVLDSFFALCKVNGVDDAQIDKFKTLIADKAQGAAGKARMTLGNILAAKARKAGFLLDQSGNQVAIDVAKPPVSGAAAKAQENAAATTETETETETTPVDGGGVASGIVDGADDE